MRIRRNCACKPWHAVHYAVLVMIGAYGLLSLLLAYANIYISLEILDGAMLVMLAASIWTIRRTGGTVLAGQPVVGYARYDAIPYLAAWALSACVGVMFFTPELVPSSMTGDAPRHLLHAMKFTSLEMPSQAWAYKPAYYLTAGLFLSARLPLDADQVFVLFNIGVFGLSVSSCAVAADSVFRNQRLPERLAAVLLVTFGYHLFALQYGYFTLLLSSAFLFASIATLSDYFDQGHDFLLGLASLFAAGVALTHAFLLPDLVISLGGVLVLRCSLHGVDRGGETRRFIRYLLPLIGVALASNAGLLDSTRIAKVISTPGFVDPDPMINLIPFIPAAIVYFLLFRRESRVQLQSFFLLAAVAFTFLMLALPKGANVSAYYVNRNQIVLLPLLSFVAMALVSRLREKLPGAALLLSSMVGALLLLPYWMNSYTPLALVEGLSNQVFLERLLEGDDMVFSKNSITASYSPLQMTGRDREELVKMGKGESRCVMPGTRRLLVLGTDHQVIWLGIYLGVQPSLARRDRMYVVPDEFAKDLNRWILDPAFTQIAVIKHLNYLIDAEDLKYVRANANLVCEGDSFAIYRKSRDPLLPRQTNRVVTTINNPLIPK